MVLCLTGQALIRNQPRSLTLIRGRKWNTNASARYHGFKHICTWYTKSAYLCTFTFVFCKLKRTMTTMNRLKRNQTQIPIRTATLKTTMTKRKN